MEKLIELITDYEESIINEESSRKQMIKYLKIDKFITKNQISHNEELKALEYAGACSQMSVLNDWYMDLMYRKEAK